MSKQAQVRSNFSKSTMDIQWLIFDLKYLLKANRDKYAEHIFSAMMPFLRNYMGILHETILPKIPIRNSYSNIPLLPQAL